MSEPDTQFGVFPLQLSKVDLFVRFKKKKKSLFCWLVYMKNDPGTQTDPYEKCVIIIISNEFLMEKGIKHDLYTIYLNTWRIYRVVRLCAWFKATPK